MKNLKVLVADVADKMGIGNTIGNTKNPVKSRLSGLLLPMLPIKL